MNKDAKTEIQIFKQKGRLENILLSQDLKKGRYELNWGSDNLSNGVYTLIWKADSQLIKTIKIIKQSN